VPALPRVLLWLLPCLLAAPMLAAVELTGHKDLLVPPAAALAFGAWVMRRPDWNGSRWRLVAVPTLTASVGLAGAWLPGPRWLAVVGVVTATLLLLQVVRCRVGPALAVAILPVVFDIRGIEYVVAVAALAGAIALVCARGGQAPDRWPTRRVVAFWAAAVAWTVLALGVLGLPPLVAAPPMFVATLDFTLTAAGPGRPVMVGAARRCLLLVGVATIGAACMRYVPFDVVGGTLAVATAGLLAAVLTEPLAPAFAVSLVPYVAGVDDPLVAALYVGLGAVALHVLAGAALLGRESVRGRPGWVGPA
jgi:hypothetical protein